MTFKRLLLVAAVAVACVPAAAWAQDAKPNLVSVKVTGAGTSEDEALKDAMRKAVEQGAGAFITSQSQTKDFVLVKDSVIARAAGFVQDHKVLSKKEMEDGTWEVTIQATVSKQGIEDWWGTVTQTLQQMGRPKIMVFVREKIGDQVQEDSTLQTRIENLLLESGFLLVNKEQLKEIDKKDLAAAVAEDSPAKVQAIAKRFGAQLFISGVANCASGGVKNIGGVDFHTYEAEANIRCYRSDTAQLLSAIPGEPTRGVDRVWRSAAKKAIDIQGFQIAPKVRWDILRFWLDVMGGRGEVQLQVEGVTFKQYVTLKNDLKKVKAVKDVTTKFANQVAECSIQSDVTAEALAEKIVEVFINLEITDVTQNVIKAKFKAE